MDALGSWWLATLVLKASTTAVQEFNFRYSVTVTQNFPHHNVLKKLKMYHLNFYTKTINHIFFQDFLLLKSTEIRDILYPF